MKMRTMAMGSLLLLCLSAGCDRSQQQEADARAEQAKAKAQAFGEKVKEESKKAAGDLDSTMNQRPNGTAGPGESANEKLHNGARDLKNAGHRAEVELKAAALITKVKSALANDVGLKTVRTIKVDADGQVITLSGTVTSADRKREAEQAAAGVAGVATVVNHLEVQ